MNSLNLEGIAYYNRLIDELINNDIIPLVSTIYKKLKIKDEVRI